MDEARLFNLLERVGIRNLRRRGGDIQGSCPSGLHADVRPSWGISLKEPHLHGCFACGFKGVLQTLLVQTGKFNPVDARIICGTLNEKAEVDTTALRNALRPKADPRVRFFSEDEMYPYALSKQAIRYFEGRGIKRLTLETARVAYDKKQNRVLYPWWYGKKLVCLVGRYIGSKPDVPKIRNYLLNKNKRRFVYLPYGKFFQGPLYICEGEADALKLVQAKYDNTCAIGQARVSEEQVNFLKNSGVSEFRIFTDDDIRGRSVAVALAEELSAFAPTGIIDYEPVRRQLPNSIGKLDPGMLSVEQIQLLLSKGAQIFRL